MTSSSSRISDQDVSKPDAATLLSFRDTLRGCQKCSLHSVGNGGIPWSGPLSPFYAVLGEAPGSQEDRYGEPFVGTSGIRLRYTLKAAGIDPSTVAYVNSVSCFPSRTPTDLEINACRPWMRGQVAMIQPTILISVGTVALQSLRPDPWPKLANLHGKPLYWDTPPVPLKKVVIWPTYHPMAGIRSAKYRRIIEEDIAELVRWVSGGMEWPIDACYVCGDEMYRTDGWGIAYCGRHSARQGILWSEEGNNG